jgi:hypothetical protein
MGFWRMKSILPPDLELKRLTIAKRHNQLVLALSSVVLSLAFIFIVSALYGRTLPRSQFIVALLIVGTAEAYGIYRILQYDKEMSSQLGFMCPHCQQPLYEPRSFINMNGRCPKCQKSILS